MKRTLVRYSLYVVLAPVLGLLGYVVLTMETLGMGSITVDGERLPVVVLVLIPAVVAVGLLHRVFRRYFAARQLRADDRFRSVDGSTATAEYDLETTVDGRSVDLEVSRISLSRDDTFDSFQVVARTDVVRGPEGSVSLETESGTGQVTGVLAGLGLATGGGVSGATGVSIPADLQRQRTGADAFDDAFAVEAATETAVERVLPPEVRSTLLDVDGVEQLAYDAESGTASIAVGLGRVNLLDPNELYGIAEAVATVAEAAEG